MGLQYPDTERRQPREHFTRKLHILCARLDEKSAGEVEFTHPALRRRKTRVAVTVKSVWVVGSYARGALLCGDLDLVVELEGRSIPVSALSTGFLGRLPDVRPHIGTPAKNDSGAAFPDAVRIWGAGLDWRRALEAIAPNPLATRFPRATDAIPLRMEQLRIDVERAVELVAARDAGQYAWRFIPLSELHPAEPSEGIKRWRQYMGAEKQKLAPYLQAYIDRFPNPSYDKGAYRDGNWTTEDTLVSLGAAVPRSDLLDGLGATRVGVLPHLSARGPNGVWEIERGPLHPLRKAFSGLSAWVVARHGVPDRYQLTSNNSWSHMLTLDLFLTEAAAQALIDDVGYDEDEGAAPRLLSGDALLGAICGLDGVYLGWKQDEEPAGPWQLALTFTGARVLEEEQVSTTDQVVETLATFCSGVELE